MGEWASYTCDGCGKKVSSVGGPPADVACCGEGFTYVSGSERDGYITEDYGLG